MDHCHPHSLLRLPSHSSHRFIDEWSGWNTWRLKLLLIIFPTCQLNVRNNRPPSMSEPNPSSMRCWLSLNHSDARAVNKQHGWVEVPCWCFTSWRCRQKWSWAGWDGYQNFKRSCGMWSNRRRKALLNKFMKISGWEKKLNVERRFISKRRSGHPALMPSERLRPKRNLTSRRCDFHRTCSWLKKCQAE